MKKSKILVFVLMLAVSLVLSGCASVSYTVGEDKNGKIVQDLVVELDKQAIESVGGNYATCFNTLEGRMENYKANIYSNYTTMIDADTSISEEEKELLKESVEITITKNTTVLHYHASFSSVSIYYYFMGIDPTEETTSEDVEKVEKGVFFNKIIENSRTVFSSDADEDGTETIYEYLNREMKNVLGPTIYNAIEKPSFTYSYQTTSRRLHSNSDKRVKENGIYTHTWTFTSAQISNGEDNVVFYSNVANTTNWYLLALGITAACFGAMIIIMMIKRKKTPKRPKEIIFEK